MGLRFLAYTLKVFPILPTRLVCTYLMLCICFCWRLFLQAGSLGKVPARLPHNSIPSYLLLHLNPDWLACFALLLLFNLTVYLYKLSVSNVPWQTSFHQRKRVCFFLALRDFYPWTSELEKYCLFSLSGLLSASWLPQSVHLLHFNFRPGYLKKIIYHLNAGCGKGKENCFCCNVSGKTGCLKTHLLLHIVLSVKVTYLCAGITLDVYSRKNFSKWNFVMSILFVHVLKSYEA